MARGKTIRTKTREAVVAAAQEVASLEIGKHLAIRKINNKKTLFESAREHIGKMIDRIDPLEAGAILGATILIKNGIEWTEDIISNQDNLKMINLFLGFAGGIASPSTWRILLMGAPTAEELDTFKKLMDSPQSEIIEWLLSFMAAFFLVRNAQNLQGSIVAAAKTLILPAPPA